MATRIFFRSTSGAIVFACCLIKIENDVCMVIGFAMKTNFYHTAAGSDSGLRERKSEIG